MISDASSDLLQLSGIQHFAFCRRQWALIHIEQQWAENYRTADGAAFHEKAHDAAAFESRGDTLISRGMYISSQRLGVSGQCDVLEFHKSDAGIRLAGRDGKWLPFPVEYKRGSPKEGEADALQLCAQAMCLEEMLCCNIKEGAIFYGETRRRLPVSFTEELRGRVEKYFAEMRDLYSRGYTPKCKPKKGCSACSLKEICMPKLINARIVGDYLREHLEDGL